MKVRRRENAGRKRRIAFHQMPHNDSDSARSGMVVSMVQVGSGHPIGTIDSQFVNHARAHDPAKTRRAVLRESEATSIPARCRHDGYPGARATAPIQTGRDGPNLFDDLMGKQRREQPQDSIFGDNPFVDGFLEWMGSREGQQCIEIHDVLWDLLEDVQLDAKRRQLIWPDAKRSARKQRLDLDQSVQRIQKLHSDFARHEVEGFLLDWIDMGYDPENYSQAQLDELDKLTEKWVADHLRKAKISKKRKRTRHS